MRQPFPGFEDANAVRVWLGPTFFSVTFLKRTKPEVRIMRARCGVLAHLKGGKLNYDAAAKQLITCYDIVKRDYRSFPLDAVIELRAHGQKLTGPMLGLALTAQTIADLVAGLAPSDEIRARLLRGS